MKQKFLTAYNFRIYPNKEQEILINKTLGSCRFIYNQMLAERISVYEKLKEDKDSLYKYKYKTEKQYKNEFEWLKEVDSVSLQQSRMDLETAYKNFFDSIKGKRKGRSVGFPKFKSKKSNRHNYRTQNINNNISIDFESKKIKLPKLKWVKYRDQRQFNGVIKNVTVKKSPSEKYFVSILVEEFIDVNIHQVNSRSSSIGLDYDSKNLFTSSTGEIGAYPRFYRKYEKKLKREQRKLSKKQPGSNNRNKQRVKVAKVHEKITNSRKDFQQKLSTDLVSYYDIIGVESLNMVGISRSLNLAKSTLDNSWGSFVNMLEYKCERQGKHLIFADKYYASSKMCNVCGYKNVDLKLNDRQWTCPICKTEHNRDINAGINLENYALGVLSTSTVGVTGFQACGEKSSGNQISDCETVLDEAGSHTALASW